MKRQGSTELPRFAVGALAIAGASAANGATVQITFANNVISTLTGAVSFNGDLTGDLKADVTGFYNGRQAGIMATFLMGGSTLGRGSRTFWRSEYNTFTYGRAFVKGVADGWSNKRGLVSLTFKDNRINGNVPTAAWVDLEAWGTESGPESGKVRIHRLIFDNASTTAPTGLTKSSTGITEWSAVPEPSSLGLLALGAGGLLARRRRQAA